MQTHESDVGARSKARTSPAVRGKQIPDSLAAEAVARRRTDVLSAGGVMRLQRLAGNASVSDVVAKPPSPVRLQREPAAPPVGTSPFAAPVGAAPADPAGLMRPVLQGLVNALINHAYTDYLSAVEAVKGEVDKTAEKAQARDPVNVLLPIVAGLCLPAFTKFAAAGLSESIQGTTRSLLITAVMKGGLKEDEAVAAFDTVKGMVSEERVGKALEKSIDLAKEGLKESVAGQSVFELTTAYVNGLGRAADLDSNLLLQTVVGISDVPTLLGLHAAFGRMSRDAFLTELRGKADHFRVQIAPTILHKNNDKIVMLNAYGQSRLAQVRVQQNGYTIFMGWITPDMEEVARQSVKGQIETIDPGIIVGHIPDPVREGGVRVVRIDAWGMPRLAEVASTSRGFLASRPVIEFVRWIPASDAENAAIRGEQQIGGINQVSPDDVENLKPPSDQSG